MGPWMRRRRLRVVVVGRVMMISPRRRRNGGLRQRSRLARQAQVVREDQRVSRVS